MPMTVTILNQMMLIMLPRWANVFLFFSVLFTLFLASNVIVLKVFSSWLPQAVYRQLLSLGIATGGMFAVCLLTSLGKDILASCKSTPASSCPLSELTDISPRQTSNLTDIAPHQTSDRKDIGPPTS